MLCEIKEMSHKTINILYFQQQKNLNSYNIFTCQYYSTETTAFLKLSETKLKIAVQLGGKITFF